MKEIILSVAIIVVFLFAHYGLKYIERKDNLDAQDTGDNS